MSAHVPLDPYSDETRRLFAKPVHAGELQGDYTVSALARCQESATGARIELAAGLRKGCVEQCRFRVYGCPHLIAAAEWWCSSIEGEAVTVLQQFDVTECMQQLGVPVEKTGRILLLEDTIGSLSQQLQSNQTN